MLINDKLTKCWKVSQSVSQKIHGSSAASQNDKEDFVPCVRSALSGRIDGCIKPACLYKSFKDVQRISELEVENSLWFISLSHCSACFLVDR